MIWMKDDTGYHISKTITEYFCRVGLICIDFLAKSLDLNPMENLLKIIKIRVSAQRHRIYLLESMKEVIEEWKKLTEKEFRTCIKSMSK